MLNFADECVSKRLKGCEIEGRCLSEVADLERQGVRRAGRRCHDLSLAGEVILKGKYGDRYNYCSVLTDA